MLNITVALLQVVELHQSGIEIETSFKGYKTMQFAIILKNNKDFNQKQFQSISNTHFLLN